MAFGAFSLFENVYPLLERAAHRIALATTAQEIKIAQLHQKSHTLTPHTPWQCPETAFANSKRPPPLKQRRLNALSPPCGSSMAMQSSPLGHVSNNVRVASFEIPAPSPPKKTVPPLPRKKRGRPRKNAAFLSKPPPLPQKQEPQAIKIAGTINTLRKEKTLDRKTAQEMEATRQVRVSENASKKLRREQNDKVRRHA